MTPERKIPALAEIPKKVWESNIPIGNDWGYVPNDTFKSSQELLETLIEVVSKGGNLILGVGPTPDGEFTFEETQRLEEIGNWLALYGEGIYETRANPIAWPNEWHLTYQKEGKAHFAFRSIAAGACEQIPLTEIGATEEDELIDLATKKALPVYKNATEPYLLWSDISQPNVGAVGIRVSTHREKNTH